MACRLGLIDSLAGGLYRMATAPQRGGDGFHWDVVGHAMHAPKSSIYGCIGSVNLLGLARTNSFGFSTQ